MTKEDLEWLQWLLRRYHNEYRLSEPVSDVDILMAYEIVCQRVKLVPTDENLQVR